MLKSDVFQRTETSSKTVPNPLYNFIIGLVLCWGFLINWLMVKNINPAIILEIPIFVFLICYFASCFFGVYLFNNYDQPIISFIGYNCVVVPFGLIVNLVVSQYDPGIVLEAIKITGIVTGVMMIMGTMFPAFFQRIAGALGIAIFAVLIIELFQIFILKTHQNWLDWAIALIFCGYIGYDWSRANQIPKTVDNAIDSAAAIYMDVINLFLRILRILGRRR